MASKEIISNSEWVGREPSGRGNVGFLRTICFAQGAPVPIPHSLHRQKTQHSKIGTWHVLFLGKNNGNGISFLLHSSRIRFPKQNHDTQNLPHEEWQENFRSSKILQEDDRESSRRLRRSRYILVMNKVPARTSHWKCPLILSRSIQFLENLIFSNTSDVFSEFEECWITRSNSS